MTRDELKQIDAHIKSSVHHPIDRDLTIFLGSVCVSINGEPTVIEGKAYKEGGASGAESQLLALSAKHQVIDILLTMSYGGAKIKPYTKEMMESE